MSKIKISLFVTSIIVASIITAIWSGSFVYAVVLHPTPSSFLRPGEKAIRAMEVIPTGEETKWQVVKTGKLTVGYYKGELPADDLVQYAVEHCDYYIKFNSTGFPVEHTGVYNNTKSYYLFHCTNASQYIDAIDPATFKPVDVTVYIATFPMVPIGWISVVFAHRHQQRKKTLPTTYEEEK
ncbi:MAG: hypothetical protein ACUVTC_05285 [Candidatus Bathycorpusculaceae bacterium]